MATSGFVELEQGTEPSAGLTGFHRLYVDESDNSLRFKKDDSTVVNLENASGYTDENAQDAVGNILLDSSTIDFNYNDATPTITADVKDNAISEVKILNDAVTTAKVLDGAITNSKLSSDSVTTIKILDSNITTNKIADANVTEVKIADNSISTNKLQNLSVNDSKIASGVDAVKIGAGLVDNTEFGYLNGITSSVQTQLDAKALNSRNIETTATSGLQGGGDLSADRSLSLNFNGLTAQSERFSSSDVIAAYDNSQAAHRKITFADFFAQRSSLMDFLHTESGDFVKDSLDGLTATGAGTGNSTQVGTYGLDTTENCVGVSQSDTGTTAAGRRALSSGLSTLITTVARYRTAWRVALEQLSNGTDTFTAYIGFIDTLAAGDQSNGAYFRYTHSVNSGKWEAVTAKAGVRTATDTGVAADILYSIFEVEISADGSTAYFWINGNLVATNTTNLPTAISTSSFGYGIKIEKSLGTTVASISADYYRFEMQRSSAR
jgi:hypothetical protein